MELMGLCASVWVRVSSKKSVSQCVEGCYNRGLSVMSKLDYIEREPVGPSSVVSQEEFGVFSKTEEASLKKC